MHLLKEIIKNFLQRVGRILYKDNLGKHILSNPGDFPEIMLINFLKNCNSHFKMFLVGACQGTEAKNLFETGAISHITFFEPVKKNVDVLYKNTSRYNNKTIIVEAAVCDFDGKINFNETNLVDNGSVLKLKNFNKNIKKKNTYEVEAIKLDTYCKKKNFFPDLLWIDVQGADLLVLKGAENILKKVRLVYIEISIWEPTHINGCLAEEINVYLSKFGFKITQLGTSFADGCGNVLYSKKV